MKTWVKTHQRRLRQEECATGWLRFKCFSNRNIRKSSCGPREPVVRPDSPAGVPGVWSGAARRMRKGAGRAAQIPRKPWEGHTGSSHTLVHFIVMARYRVPVELLVRFETKCKRGTPEPSRRGALTSLSCQMCSWGFSVYCRHHSVYLFLMIVVSHNKEVISVKC